MPNRHDLLNFSDRIRLQRYMKKTEFAWRAGEQVGCSAGGKGRKAKRLENQRIIRNAGIDE